jgi:hypothetical protein
MRLHRLSKNERVGIHPCRLLVRAACGTSGVRYGRRARGRRTTCRAPPFGASVDLVRPSTGLTRRALVRPKRLRHKQVRPKQVQQEGTDQEGAQDTGETTWWGAEQAGGEIVEPGKEGLPDARREKYANRFFRMQPSRDFEIENRRPHGALYLRMRTQARALFRLPGCDSPERAVPFASHSHSLQVRAGPAGAMKREHQCIPGESVAARWAGCTPFRRPPSAHTAPAGFCRLPCGRIWGCARNCESRCVMCAPKWRATVRGSPAGHLGREEALRSTQTDAATTISATSRRRRPLDEPGDLPEA